MLISDIKINKDIIPRNKLQEDAVERYKDVFEALPPIIVQAGTNILIDGFHRIQAAIKLGKKEISVEKIDIPDNKLFETACKYNLKHGLPLTKDERNKAIVKLYGTGNYSIRDLEEIWGISKSQISRIIGAKKRTQRVGVPRRDTELTPRHEEIIRQAPKELQDDIAEVVLNREDNHLSVDETRTLVKLANENTEKVKDVLSEMNTDKKKRPITSTKEDGSTDFHKLANAVDKMVGNKLTIRFSNMIQSIIDLKAETDVHELALAVKDDKLTVEFLEISIDYLESLLIEITTLLGVKNDTN